MRGTILGVHDGRGFLLGADERRLEFPLSEWRSAGAPTAGQIVDYVEEAGEARSVFAVPAAGVRPPPMSGTTQSGSFVLGAIAVGCLALGFFIPFLPTLAALVLGIMGAARAQEEGDDNGLLLARIAWIGALVLLGIGVLAVVGIIALVGGLYGFAAIWNGLGPIDF